MLIPHVLLSSKEEITVLRITKQKSAYLSFEYLLFNFIFFSRKKNSRKLYEGLSSPIPPYHRTATATASHRITSSFQPPRFQSFLYKVVFCIVLRFGVCIHTFIAFYNDAFLFSQKNISNTTTTTSCWLNSFSFSSSSSSHPITIILNKRNTTQWAIWCIWSESEMRTLVKKEKIYMWMYNYMYSLDIRISLFFVCLY